MRHNRHERRLLSESRVPKQSYRRLCRYLMLVLGGGQFEPAPGPGPVAAPVTSELLSASSYLDDLIDPLILWKLKVVLFRNRWTDESDCLDKVSQWLRFGRELAHGRFSDLPPIKCRPLKCLTRGFGAVRLTRTSGLKALPTPDFGGPSSIFQDEGASTAVTGSFVSSRAWITAGNGSRTSPEKLNPVG